MAEVIVNIKANTGQATAGVDDLNDSLNKTEQSADDLSASLAKQEARIKTLDGAINLIGGTVEVLAGGLALTGALTEEQAENFQAAAVGAIAFADGTKRILDGYKSLNEGLASYGGITGAATKATKALNAAVLANPWVAVAVGVAALTAAIYLYVEATDEATEAQERLARQQAATAQANTTYADTEVRLAQARGEAQSVVLGLQLKAIEAREAEIAQLLDSNIETAEANKLLEEGRKLYQDTKVVKEQLKKATADEAAAALKAEADKTQKLKDENAKRKAEQDKARADELAAEKKFLDDVFKAQQDLTEKLKSEFEKRKSDRQALADYEHELLMEEFQDTIDNLEKRKKKGEEALQAEMTLLQAQLQLTQAVGDGIANLGALFEQGTAAAKTAAIADIAINTAIGFVQALDIAQKGAAGTGPAAPFAFPIFYASQIAAILGAVASAKQVLSTTPGGSGGIVTTQPQGAIGSGTPRINRPDLGMGGFLSPTGTPTLAPAEPIQAYVLASDVTTGLQAYGQISRRRRFG